MSSAGGKFTPTVPPKPYFPIPGDPMPSAEAVAEFCAAVAKNGVTSAQFAEAVRGNAIVLCGWDRHLNRYVNQLLRAEDQQRIIQAGAGCTVCGAPVSEMVIKREPDLTEKVTFVCADHAPGDETLDAWLARIAG